MSFINFGFRGRVIFILPFLFFFKLFLLKIYFVLYLILSLILLTKQITMTPEDRQKAIAGQFLRISIYCIVQNEFTNASGLHRLEHMKKIIDEVEVISGVDGLDFNHRYFKGLLDNSIIETKAWLNKINEI